MEEISDVIAARDTLMMKNAIYRDLAATATITPDIRTNSDVECMGTVKGSQVQCIVLLITVCWQVKLAREGRGNSDATIK
jgi:hypothetical protein